MSTITGFIDCDECGSEHAPVSGRCPFKIEKDASFVLDASGAAISPAMVAQFVLNIEAQLGSRAEGHRYVLPEVQYKTYRRWGYPLAVKGEAVKLKASGGTEWLIDDTLPPDMFLIEWPGMFGVIKKLCTWAAVDNEESLI